MNQNVADITIFWPDDKWEPKKEQEYLLSCLQGIKEQLEHFPLKEREQKRVFMNCYGRIYAEMEVRQCHGSSATIINAGDGVRPGC